MAYQFWVKLSVWLAGCLVLQTILLLVTLIVPIGSGKLSFSADTVEQGIGYLTTIYGQPMMGQDVWIDYGGDPEQAWWNDVEDVQWE